MKCANIIVGICLTRPPQDTGGAIFGFSEFLAALALLVLVFNSTDYLYRFRIAVAPIPLVFITFVATIIIGVGTLLTDLWFAERWLALPWGLSRATLQGMFGGLFLLTVLLWIWFAFISPPIFGRWNSKRYHLALYTSVVRGSDTELPMIAAEVMRSAAALIQYVGRPGGGWQKRAQLAGEPEVPKVSRYANDTLLMLGNRKLCRQIVASSPITAIVLMETASSSKSYNAPLGEFARNITTEAIINKDSIIYLEDGLNASDLMGIIQPFSTAMYGDYWLVEQLGSSRYSPLDIDWRVAKSLDGDQFAAYCRITLITFKNYVESDRYRGHSTALYRAFEIIGGAGDKVAQLDGIPPDGELDVASSRLMAAVYFVADVIDFLGDKEGLKFGRLRVRRDASDYYQSSVFDQVAKLLYEIVHHAAYVRTPSERAWSIQYNAVWGQIFGVKGENSAWKVIRFKFFRILFDDIKVMERWPNYSGARILGICLNVLGLTIGGKDDYRRQTYPLHKAVLDWTRRNYISIVRANPDIAAYCLSGGVTFDAEHKRLIKTYFRGTNLVAPREYLQLDDPPPLT